MKRIQNLKAQYKLSGKTNDEIVRQYFVEIFSLDIMVKLILVIINKVAIIDVVFVKKFPADLDVTKLSCEAPSPSAPPSDFCKSIVPISKIAKIIFRTKTKFSITAIYSNFLLYQ